MRADSLGKSCYEYSKDDDDGRLEARSMGWAWERRVVASFARADVSDGRTVGMWWQCWSRSETMRCGGNVRVDETMIVFDGCLFDYATRGFARCWIYDANIRALY